MRYLLNTYYLFSNYIYCDIQIERDNGGNSKQTIFDVGNISCTRNSVKSILANVPIYNLYYTKHIETHVTMLKINEQKRKVTLETQNPTPWKIILCKPLRTFSQHA